MTKPLLPQRQSSPLYRAKRYVDMQAGMPDPAREERAERLRQLSARQPVVRGGAPVVAAASALETPVSIANGGTGAATAAAAAANLGAELLLIEAPTVFSAQASVAFDGVFTSDYDNYVVVLTDFSASAAGDILWQNRASASNATTGYYSVQTSNFSNASSESTEKLTNQGAWYFWVDAGVTATNGEIVSWINAPAKAVRTTAYNQSAVYWASTPGVIHQQGGGMHNVATAYDGFRLFTNGAGNFSGTIYIYGRVM